MQKLEGSWGVPRDLGCSRTVSTYTDYITIIVSKMAHLQRIGMAIEDYKAEAGAKVNRDKSVSLQLGTCWEARRYFLAKSYGVGWKDLVWSRSLHKEELKLCDEQGDPPNSDLVWVAAMPERKSGGCNSVYHFYDDLPRNRRVLLPLWLTDLERLLFRLL